MSIRSYQYMLERLTEKVGVRKLNFHALRHTFVFRAIECGIDQNNGDKSQYCAYFDNIQGAYGLKNQGGFMKRKLILIFVLLIVAIAIVLLCLSIAHNKDSPQQSTPYEVLVKNGYTGTAEEWLASLVGETVDASAGNPTAYQLAVGNGYNGTLTEWMEIHLGELYTGDLQTTFQAACEQGYTGTLNEWLNFLVKDPDVLGKSSIGEQKTTYEIACEYGFEGTFIDWIISLVNG